MARSFIHEPKTAQTAPQSCSQGHTGNSLPVRSLTAALKAATSSFRSSVVRSVSFTMPRLAFWASISSSKGSWSSFDAGFISSTTSPYIWTKRRYESQAKRGLPLSWAIASTASSFMPRLRIVSIMPGIDARAPERTERSSGICLSPNLRPVSVSILATAFSTSGFSRAITASLPWA